MTERLSCRLSKHARRRMAQRGVTIQEVRRTLAHPDRVERDEEDLDLLHAIKRFFHPGGSRVLHVVYNGSVLPWQIVTVFFEWGPRDKK